MRRSGCYAAVLGVFAGTLGIARLQAQAPAPATPDIAQGQSATPGGGRRGQFAGMARVAGEVTGVSGATVTVKAEDGSTMQVVTTDNTRIMKDRGTVKPADLHPGDGIMAFGNLDAGTKTLHAAMLMATDAAQIKAARENLGKTYIVGRVTAIDLDNAKMTVERADHVSQTIGFDESTSFKRAVRGGGGGGNNAGGPPRGEGAPGGGGPGGGGFGGGGFGMGMGMGGMMGPGMDRAFERGESITLADIKVGDSVMGNGSVKNGTFVPARLMDSPPGQRRGGNATAPGSAAPAPPGSSNQ